MKSTKTTSGKPIFYYDRKTQVMLGDHVRIRIWFKKHIGRVIYVPGVSKPNPTMEYGGLVDVGIQITDGPFVATVVDPQGSFLKKKILFLKRDSSGIVELDSQRDPFGEE